MLPQELEEINRHVGRSKSSYQQISSAEAGGELRDAWEDFLTHFKRSIERMIKFGNLDANLRPRAHILRNAFTKDDEGLIYLREARNHVDHGLTPFAELVPPHLNIGGVIGSGGNTYISGCQFGDQYVPYMQLEAKKGKLIARHGDKSVRVTEKPATIRLKKIHNEENGKTFAVPNRLGGKTIKPNAPTDLAKVALVYIDELLSEWSEG